MFRVAISTKKSQILSRNFTDRESADTWVLENMDESKRIIIQNQETKEREIINND